MTAFCQAETNSRFTEVKIRQYMPGDIVHIVVEAPFDTTGMSAVMPDEQQAILSFDSRNNVWHGYWQVPPGFKKGVYTARLFAIDVEGRNFEGTSAQFVVSEPVMTLMVQMAPQKANQVVPSRPRLKQQEPVTQSYSEPASVPQIEAQDKLQPEPVPAPQPKSLPNEVKPKPKIVAQPRPKPKKRVVVQKPEDISLTMANLIIAAKKHMVEQDYVKAKEKLLALLKLNPENSEIRLMIARLDAIIRAGRMQL